MDSGRIELFSFPVDARWNETGGGVEFGIMIGEYRGVVRVPRRTFQRLLDGPVTPKSCLEAFHINRSAFERAAETKLRARQLTDDGNVELNARDLEMA
jgi:hypothetical protein